MPLRASPLHAADTLAARADRARHLGRMPRLLFFLTPVVAATNQVLPAIGPISPLPLLAALLFLIAAMRVRNGSEFGRVRASAWLFALPLLVISLFTLATRFGALWAHNEAVAVVSGLLILLSVCMLRLSGETLRLLLNGWLFAFAVTSALAAVELATGMRFGESYVDVNPLTADLGVVSVFYNPNNYAGFIAFSFPIFVAGRAMARARWARLAHVLGLITAVPLMLATNSRFGLAAFVVFGGLWAVLRWRSAIVRLLVTLITFTVVGFVAFFANAAIGEYWGRINYTIPFFGAEIPVDASLFARWNLMLNGFDTLATNPLLGAGSGGYEIHAESATTLRETFKIINPHNGAIELLSQYGVVIFLIGCALTLLLLHVGWRSLHESDIAAPERAIAFALISAVAMLPLVLLMNSSYLEILYTWVALAIFVAMGIHLSTSNDSNHESGGPSDPKYVESGA